MSEPYRAERLEEEATDDRPRLSHALHAAILGLAADDTAARISAALADAGIPVILLKGAATTALLYPDGEVRGYGDADLLVPPDRIAEARRLLADLGYRPRVGVDLPASAKHAATFDPPAAGASVDLHWTIAGARVEPERLWAELHPRHTTTLPVGGRPLVVLDEPGRALHLMLHAFQHGPAETKPLHDLNRAIEHLPESTWLAAGTLAARLGAFDAAVSGLYLTPSGRDLTRRLAWAAPENLLARLHALPGGPGSAKAFYRWQQAPTLMARLRYARAVLFPSPAYMRLRYGIAGRGGVGLALAYVWRCAVVTGRLPGAVTKLVKAHRARP